MSAAEAVLWKSLQRRQLLGRKFRRQISIGRYIVDFYCPDCRLVIELDGEAHFSHNIDVYQDRRTKFLEKQGLTVMRFENRELKENLDGVWSAPRERESVCHKLSTGRSAGFMFEIAASNSAGGR